MLFKDLETNTLKQWKFLTIIKSRANLSRKNLIQKLTDVVGGQALAFNSLMRPSGLLTCKDTTVLV